VVELTAKCCCCPSRDGALGVIGMLARPALPITVFGNYRYVFNINAANIVYVEPFLNREKFTNISVWEETGT